MAHPPAADGFTRARLALLEAALADEKLTHLACRVLGLLALRYCNREAFARTGRLEAWPGQQTLAKETGSTPDGVRKAVLQLQSAGCLEIVPGRGRGNTTRYHLGKSQIATGVFGAKSQNVPVLLGGQTPDGHRRKTPTGQGTNPLNLEPDWIPKEVRREIARGSGRGAGWADRMLSKCDWCPEERALITDADTASSLRQYATAGIRLAAVRLDVRAEGARRA